MSAIHHTTDRRGFLRHTLGAAAASLAAGAVRPGHALADDAPSSAPPRPEYQGLNVVLIRFGGGVRRRETLEPGQTYCPWFLHDLCPRGTLYRNMLIEKFLPPPNDDVELDTSHGQGTLFILTGQYHRYQDVKQQFLKARFEAPVPTLFEYLRRNYDVPAHQTLIVNGEDRTDEEFYSFSNHHLFGVDYRCNVLSLYRFKTYLLRRQIEEGRFKDKELVERQKDLNKMLALDHRRTDDHGQGEAIDRYWQRWREHYGETGLVNARGDRLLTELTLRALKELRPRLVMVNYNDPDYVHWGHASHYTRAIAVIDEGIRRLVDAVEADPFYRGNTVFVVVPDCGRDSNPFAPVPYQHHFNSDSARRIFALLVGPGVERGQVIDRPVQQIQVAATVGRLMGFDTPYAESEPLKEALA